MASKIGIVSTALVLCGHDTINSLNDPGRVPRIASVLYDNSKEPALKESNWSFAKKKVQLAKLTSPPVSEYQNAYQIPADCLKILKILPRTDYRIFGDQIYTNSSGPLFLDYTANVSEDRFTPDFAKYLAYVLATEGAIPIREGNVTSQMLEQRAIKVRAAALYSDSSQAPQDKIASSPFTAARFQ